MYLKDAPLVREPTVDEEPAQPLSQVVDMTADIRRLCGGRLGQRGGPSRVNTVADRKPMKVTPKIDEAEEQSDSDDLSDGNDSSSSSD